MEKDSEMRKVSSCGSYPNGSERRMNSAKMKVKAQISPYIHIALLSVLST